MPPSTSKIWIALSIGNSRYHWAWFVDTKLQSSWDTAYFTAETLAQIESANLTNSGFLQLLPIDLQQEIAQQQAPIAEIPIYLASVVPSQTLIWQQLAQIRQITVADLPLLNLYPTFGIDRALAILGAGETYGYPALVIDGGTALTISGVDDRQSLVGGAIMPGLRLQFQSLFTNTAALPAVDLPAKLPLRWSHNTSEAISSGILYSIIAGIRDFILDWEQLFPHRQIVFTGGDGKILSSYLQSILPFALSCRVTADRLLLFRGIAKVVGRSSLP